MKIRSHPRNHPKFVRFARICLGEKIFSKNPESRRWLIIGVTTPRYKVGKVVSQAEGRLLIACLLLLTLPLLRLHTPLAPFVLLFHEPSLVVR